MLFPDDSAREKYDVDTVVQYLSVYDNNPVPVSWKEIKRYEYMQFQDWPLGGE